MLELEIIYFVGYKASYKDNYYILYLTTLSKFITF